MSRILNSARNLRHISDAQLKRVAEVHTLGSGPLTEIDRYAQEESIDLWRDAREGAAQ